MSYSTRIAGFLIVYDLSQIGYKILFNINMTKIHSKTPTAEFCIGHSRHG